MQTLSVGHVPTTWPTTPVAHNGYVQALSDGGLLLAMPFFLACAALAWYVLAAAVTAIRHRKTGALGFLVPILLGALMMHSFVDFDWTFPAHFLLAAILGGMMCGARWAGQGDRLRPGRPQTSCAVLVGVLILAFSALIARDGDPHGSLPVSAGPTIVMAR